MASIEIVGRRSSLFTRLALIVAEELRVPYTLTPIYDMKELAPAVYAGNPALKLPILRRDESVLFGTMNICRALAEIAPPPTARVVWPEDLRDDLTRNAQELIWHCMSAQVQLVMGTLVGKLPTDNVFFVKARTGLENSLSWLEANIAQVFVSLPSERDLSILEASLFCLLDHLHWRQTLSVDAFASLREYTECFAKRASARATAYQFDAPPN